jgi:hypothetical protein
VDGYSLGGANGALTLLSLADESVVRGLTWLIEFGPSGSGMGFDRGKKLVKILKAKGARNELRGAVSPFAHDWRHADEHLEQSLPIHHRVLGAAAR